MKLTTPKKLIALSLAATCAGAITTAASAAPSHAAARKELVGTFKITSGMCSGKTVSGSYLQMILPTGNASGPFMSNSDSRCSNNNYTTLSPGKDGGLETGKYQTSPSPAFSSSGNALSDKITAPADYEGTAFATATNKIDPQTKLKVPAPVIYVTGNKLSGDLRAFGVTWNRQYFNQGSPKPNGTYPGASTKVSGTYNAKTGAYTLSWISQVVGGPFNSFSCHWHLTGHFVASRS